MRKLASRRSSSGVIVAVVVVVAELITWTILCTHHPSFLRLVRVGYFVRINTLAMVTRSRTRRQIPRPLHQKKRVSQSTNITDGTNRRPAMLDVEGGLWQATATTRRSRTSQGAMYTHIIGSDDSGQGCIAGPIVTASISFLHPHLLRDEDILPEVSDSKQLNSTERERIFQHIWKHSSGNPPTQLFKEGEHTINATLNLDPPIPLYVWSYAVRTNTDVDAGTLEQVTMDCFRESIEEVVAKLKSIFQSQPLHLYSIVDGKKSPAALSIASRPWVKADTTVYTVALASIVARVIRDRVMEEMALLYPQYRFDEHGGYPTPRHHSILHALGPSPIHRLSTRPVRGRVGNTVKQSKNGLSELDISELSSRQQFIHTMVGVTGIWQAGRWLTPEPSRAMVSDSRTGVLLPERGEIEAAIPRDWNAIENPFTENIATLFSRLDSSEDSIFYSMPRFVEHIDDQAVVTLTNYITNVAIQQDTESVLDLCSSWTSHINLSSKRFSSLKRVVGIGMNPKELQANIALNEWVVQDLNRNPQLPYQEDIFDVVLCQLSIDYLTKPLAVCREISRVLKPGGTVHIIFSNRLFLDKAVALWTGADDIDHTFIVASYLHFCDGDFTSIKATDLSTRKGRDQKISGDPLYVVAATKASVESDSPSLPFLEILLSPSNYK